MRFNVWFNGKRTTARIADDVWELFVFVCGGDDAAQMEVERFFYNEQVAFDQTGRASLSSPSEALRSFLIGFIRAEISND